MTTALRLFAALLITFAWLGCSKKHEHAGDAVEGGDEHGGQAAHSGGKEHAGEKADEEDEEGDEHAGEEHEGEEHGGEEHGDDEADEDDPDSFTAADIKRTMRAHIKRRTKGGVFKIKDDDSGEWIELQFVKIHDPVRKIEGKGYFACTDFRVKGAKVEKLYDLDFWLSPKDGQLAVTKERIHKHPERKAGEWVKVARYTFVDDEPVEVR